MFVWIRLSSLALLLTLVTACAAPAAQPLKVPAAPATASGVDKEPGPTPVRPTATPVSLKPSPTPEPPTPTPVAKPEWLPGLQSGDIKVNMERRGLQCKGPTAGKTVSLWTCSLQRGDVEYRIDFMGTPTRIRSVSAAVMQYGARPSDNVAAEFLGFAATLPYDGANPSQARTWVEANLSQVDTGTPIETIVGDAKFSLSGPARARILDIVALGAKP